MSATTGVRKWKLAEARILKLGDEADGRPKPETVVADARSPSSPLHDYFDWNDETAAHARRLDVARRLIGCVRVVIHRGKTTMSTPHYVHDPALGPGKQGYVDMPNVMSNDDTRRDVMIQELNRAASSLVRARGVAAALGHDYAAIARAERMIENFTGTL